MRDRPGLRSAARGSTALLAFVAPAAAAVALLRLQGPALGLPRSARPASVATWWSERPPLDAVAAIGRWVAVLALAWIALSVVVTVRHGLRPGRVSSTLVHMVPRVVRVPLMTVLAVGVVTAPAGASSDGGSRGAPPSRTDDVPTMQVVGPAPPTTSSTTSTTPMSATVPTTSTTATTTVTTEVATAVTVAPEPATTATTAGTTSPAEPPAPSQVVVQPGDHLWGLAAEALGQRLGRIPTDEEVAPYWRTVVAANADRLVVPGDPDLILPGQVLMLPPLP